MPEGAHRLRDLAAVASVAVLLLDCLDDPSGPGAQIEGRFSLAPAFPAAASGIVDVGSMRITVVGTLRGAVVVWPYP